MSTLTAQLEQLVKRFSLVSNVAGAVRPGQVAQFELRLPPIDPGLSDWLPNVAGTSEIDQDLTGTLLGDIEDGAINGNLVSSTLNGTLTGTTAGTIRGTIQGKATGTVATIAHFRERVPIGLKVKWSFEYLDRPEPNELVPGRDFLSSDRDVTGLALSILFKPPIMEMRMRPRLPQRVRVTATVTASGPSIVSPPGPLMLAASLNPKATATFTLPDLLLLPVELPTFLALFRLEDFKPYATDGVDIQANPLAEVHEGFVLIIYPDNCPVPASLETLNGMLQRVDEVLAPLRSLVGMATFLDELSILRKSVAAQPMMRIVGAPVRKFNDIHMNVETFGFDVLNQDRRPDNRVSSLIFVGQPGRQVHCFRHHNFEPGDGAFTITLPDTMFVKIRSLKIGNAAMNDIDGVTVTNDTEDNFDDNMSSAIYLQAIPA